MLRDDISTWFESGDSVSFDRLVHTWTLPDVLRALLSAFPSYPEQGIIADRLACASSLRPVPRPVRTVGTFYYRAHTGGAEHVISQLASMWTAAGYRVVLFTDFPPEASDYPLPEGAMFFRTLSR